MMDEKGRKISVKKVFVFGIVILIIGILSPVVINNPAFISYYDMGKYGDIVKGFNGFFTPFVALTGVVVTFAAFYIQFQANEDIRKEFKFQQSSNQFYTMLDLHTKNVEKFEIRSYQSSAQDKRYELIVKEQVFDRKCDFKSIINKVLTTGHQDVDFEVLDEYKNNFPKKSKVGGRRCFLLMIKDLHFSIFCVTKVNEKLNEKLDENEILELAYKIFFWGTNSPYLRLQNPEKDQTILKIISKLNELKYLIRNKARGEKITFDYHATNGTFGEIKGEQDHFRFIPLSGHSSRLAHYFRHLYQTVKQIHLDIENKNITEGSGFRFFKTLRAQMSNEEQLLLYYNYRIGLGDKWDRRYDKKKWGEYEFLTKYKMLHNIPLYNSIYKGVEHPEDHFKEFIDANPDFDLFEWS